MTKPEVRLYGTTGHVVESVEAMAMHLPDKAVAQVSSLPEGRGSGFLVRVWAPGDIHEHGGTNLTSVTMVVKFNDDGTPRLEAFEWRPPFDR